MVNYIQVISVTSLLQTLEESKYKNTNMAEYLTMRLHWAVRDMFHVKPNMADQVDILF